MDSYELYRRIATPVESVGVGALVALGTHGLISLVRSVGPATTFQQELRSWYNLTSGLVLGSAVGVYSGLTNDDEFLAAEKLGGIASIVGAAVMGGVAGGIGNSLYRAATTPAGILHDQPGRFYRGAATGALASTAAFWMLRYATRHVVFLS